MFRHDSLEEAAFRIEVRTWLERAGCGLVCEPVGLAAVAVKAKASESAPAVTQACIQLHGAIGFADEHDIGLYRKPAMGKSFPAAASNQEKS